MLNGQHDHVLLLAQNFRCNLGKLPGDSLEDFPVAACFPRRIRRCGERMDERVHVGGIEIVLLIPCGRRQDDIRIDAGRGHAEVERDQQVQLSFRRLIMPNGFLGTLAAFLSQVLAKHTMRGAEQMLEEVFVSLAGRSEQIGAPDKQVARPIPFVIGVFARHAKLAGLQLLGNVVLRLQFRLCSSLGNLQRVCLQLRRRWQPPHPLRANVVVDQRCIPVSIGCGRRKDFIDLQCLVAPLIGMRVEEGCRVHLARRPVPIKTKSQR